MSWSSKATPTAADTGPPSTTEIGDARPDVVDHHAHATVDPREPVPILWRSLGPIRLASDGDGDR